METTSTTKTVTDLTGGEIVVLRSGKTGQVNTARPFWTDTDAGVTTILYKSVRDGKPFGPTRYAKYDVTAQIEVVG